MGSSVISGIVVRFQNSSGICDINPTTSSLTCSSDMNLKKNITKLADNSSWSFDTNITFDNQSVLAKLLALNPADYKWNSEKNSDPKHGASLPRKCSKSFLTWWKPTLLLICWP